MQGIPFPSVGFAAELTGHEGLAPRSAGRERGFPGGGGRKAAAGINALEQDMLKQFVEQFEIQFGKTK